MFKNLGISSPSETSVRNKVDKNFDTFIGKIKMQFSDVKYYLIIDESQINNKKYINIIFRNVIAQKEFCLVEVI